MFESLDIIILAVIAVFVIFKLYNLLGQSDHEYMVRDPHGKKILDILPIEITDLGAISAKNRKDSTDFTPGINVVISQIKSIDANFDPNRFLEVASKAFEIIISAYSVNDVELLKTLLSKEVFNEFSREISLRKSKGEILEKTLISIDAPKIVDAKLNKDIAVISVQFSSQQVNLIKNSAGKITKGKPDEIDDIKEVWTFSHNLKSTDPTWQLISTKAS